MLYNHNLKTFNPLFASSSVLWDTDALNFISVVGITDNTQKLAVNFLYRSLKGTDTSFNPSGVDFYTGAKAFYPFVGGTASTHKWNGKDVRDLDAAFRILWTGTVTHNANGITGDGSTGYGDTRILPQINCVAYSSSLVWYSRTNDMSRINGIGCTDTTAGTSYQQQMGTVNNGTLGDGTANFGTVTTAPSNSQKTFVLSRTANNLIKLFRDGVLVGSNSNLITEPYPLSYLSIGAITRQTGLRQNYSNLNYSFAGIFAGIIDADAVILTNIIQQYQTILGRNV